MRAVLKFISNLSRDFPFFASKICSLRGTWITVARDGPGYGVWFATYEFCTQKLSEDGKASSLTTSQLLLAGGYTSF